MRFQQIITSIGSRSIGTRSNCTRGSILPEMSIVVPIILSFAALVLDIGRGLETYVNLTRIVYEGSRTGSILASLEPNDLSGSPNPVQWINLDFDPITNSDISQSAAANGAFQQWLVQRRVRTLVSQVYNLPISDVTITTQYIPEDNPNSPAPNTGVITTSITANYRSLWTGLALPLNVSFSAPYMSASQACDRADISCGCAMGICPNALS